MSLSASIIIPTKDRPFLLKKTLLSVLPQLERQDEVIVVENGPAFQQTRQLVEDFQEQTKTFLIRYVHEPKVGPSYARNRGIALAQRKILVFLDDDCRPEKNWLKTIKKRHLQEIKTGRQQVFQGKIIFTYGQPDFIAQLFRLRHQLDWKYVRQTPAWKAGHFIHFLNAGNFSVRKDVLLKNKIYFNERFFPFMLEERDLAAQFHAAGIPIHFVADMRAVHFRVKSNPWLALLRAFQFGKYKKVFEAVYAVPNSPSQKLAAFPHKKKPPVPFITVLSRLAQKRVFFLPVSVIWLGLVSVFRWVGAIYGAWYVWRKRQDIRSFRAKRHVSPRF